MSFSKVASEVNIDGFNDAELCNFLNDLSFTRKHPFLTEWKEWNHVCFTYHSDTIRHLCQEINKGLRKAGPMSHIPEFCWLIDEVHWQTYYISSMMFDGVKPDYIWNMKTMNDTAQPIGIVCDCYDDDDITEWTTECYWKELHLKAKIIAFMWAFLAHHKRRRCVRKYYKRLERVILSLPYDKLKNMNMTLITEPPHFTSRGRFLLKQLYERAYFDKFDIKNLPFQFEELKHFVKQQSGTNQCVSAILPDEIVSLAESVFEKYTLEECIDKLRVKQQWGFGIKHTVDIADSNFDKLRDIVSNSQESFMVGMRNMLIDTGRAMLIMFSAASTIALLAKVAAGFSLKVIMKLLHWIFALVCGDGMKSAICDSERVTQQSNEDELTIPYLPAMILKYVVNAPPQILSTIWNDRQTDVIMRRIGYLGDPKIERGIEKLTEWVYKMALATINWYCRRVGINEIQDISKESCELNAWSESCDEIVKMYYADNFEWNDTNYTTITQLYSKGLTLSRTPMYYKYRTMIWKTVTSLGNLLEKFKLHGRGSSIRNPPVTIYLTGGTGVGKSSITYPIAVEILKMINQKEQFALDLSKNWKQLIYMRSAEQEFWDGYENQLVTVFDDFNQQCDSSSNPSTELFEIIRASNSFPYPLHMADINQKANTCFTSKIIIVSSNMERPKTASLNFPDALNRRFDICVRVNRKKIDGQMQSDRFDPSLYELELYDIQTNAPIADVSYKELVHMCAGEYFRRRSFVDSVESYITGLFGEPAQQQGPKAFGVVDKYGKFLPMTFMERLQYRTEKIINGTISSIFNPWMALDSFKNQFDEWRVGACRWDDDREKRFIFYQLNQCTDYFKKQYNKIYVAWNKFKTDHPYLANAAIMLTVLATCLGFLKMYYSISNSFTKKRNLVTPEAFAEAYNPGQIKGAKHEAYSPSVPKGAKVEGYTPSLPKGAKVEAAQQGVKDINATEILLSVARKNLYKITESTRDVAIGHCFFLKGKVALMPKHYLSAFEKSLRNDSEATVSFEAVLLKRSFTIRIADLLQTRIDYESPDESNGPVWSRDLMVLIVDTSIVHADATSYFCNKGSLARVDSTEVCLPVLIHNDIKNSDRAILMIRMAEGRSQLTRKEQLAVGDDDTYVLRYIRDAWQYNLDTKTSECGAPLIVRNAQVAPGKICGIHVAGIEGTGAGFSTPLYKEDIQKILAMCPQEATFEQKIRLNLEEYVIQQGCQVPIEAEFLRLGLVKKPVAQPGKSKIEPSLCHASIQQPKTKPCLLNKTKIDGKEFDPRAYRLGRLGNYTAPIKEELIQNAKRALVDEISSVLEPASEHLTSNIKNVYSFEEAVKGIDGEPYVSSIKRSTSPGYPFVHLPGCEKRTGFFGESEEYDLSSPQCQLLRKRVEDIIENAKQGIVLDHVFMDTLKDERKPIHKAHKTRLFAAGPIDYLIACKMYFNPIVAVLQKMRNWCHISVGTNPYSQDWDEIARSLLRKSKKMVAGDFEGFDASQHKRLLEIAGEVLIELSKRFCGTTEEDAKIMRVLLVSLFNSIHIIGNEIYQWTHSLPSGHYLTAIINSIFVNIAFLCIWQIAFTVSYYCARDFYKKCAIVAYGDDHIVSIADSAIGKFNQLTLTDLFKQIGLSYTMEDKDAVATEPFRELSQISYLKRGFLKDEFDGKWYAPLSLDTVLETPMWLHKCADKKLQTIDNLEWALKELSLHKPEVWAQWSPVLRREGEKLGHYTSLCDQKDARMVCLSQDFDM